jgi:hypothetical protein
MAVSNAAKMTLDWLIVTFVMMIVELRRIMSSSSGKKPSWHHVIYHYEVQYYLA